MKYLSHVLIAGGLVAVVWSMPALRAEDQSAGMKSSKHHEMMGEGWQEKLGLSSDQADKLKAAMKAKKEAEKPLQKQLAEDLKKLGAEITLKYKDSDIQATLDDMTTARKAMQAAHENFISSLNSFLTPTQRAKMLLSMMKRMGQGGRGHESWGEHEGHHAGFERGGHGDGHFAGASDLKDAPDNGGRPAEEESQDAQN